MPISLSAARNETAGTSHRFMPRPIRDGDAPVTLNAQLRALHGYSSRRHFRRDETIFGEGGPADCVYKVISGTVRLCRYPPGGHRHIAGFVLEGDVMGLPECTGQPAAAEAVSDVTLLSYPKACVERARVPCRSPETRHPPFGPGGQGPKERLATFLVRLADRTDLMQGERLDLPMSRQDIADHLGLAVETIHCALAALKSSGAISMPGAHELILSDMRALRVIAVEN